MLPHSKQSGKISVSMGWGAGGEHGVGGRTGEGGDGGALEGEAELALCQTRIPVRTLDSLIVGEKHAKI